MVKVKHLENAPIMEALIDIRARLPIDLNIKKQFSPLKKELSPKYKKIERRTVITGSIEVKDGKPVVETGEDAGITGYRFTSRDKKEVAQFRKDGFTFSRLKPYTDWETVYEEAKRLWELYNLRFSPQVIERISTQYINRVDIPIKNDLEEYFTTSPKLPKTLPQVLNLFFTKLLVEERDLQVNITQTTIPSPEPEHVGIILDIEVFKEDENGLDETKIWPTLCRMRELKNRVFFKLIKGKTARMFE